MFMTSQEAAVGGVKQAHLIDRFARRIDYLRLSVTDRCNFRCTYCMPKRQRFQPKPDVLSPDEIDRLCGVFIRRGIRKIRITGGEPLVRRDFPQIARLLSRHLLEGPLEELTLTTNGTELARYAPTIAAFGIRRVNVSLDSLEPETFTWLTRGGDVTQVLKGIEAASAAGLQVKLNIVALCANHQELPALISFAHARGMDASLIETMPLGEIEQARVDQYLPLDQVRQELEERWTLEPTGHRTCGPARYVRVKETGGTLGFITPLTNNFCASCNRIRLTATGTLFTCLGHEESCDLRTPLRARARDGELELLIDEALARKPLRHDFRISGARPLARPMSLTGG